MDFIPIDVPDQGRAYRPCPGGSLLNVARALGRLGIPTDMLCGISTDFFGDELVEGLRQSRVDARFVQRLDLPSTLGFVSLDRIEPSYAFYDAQAAERMWNAVPDQGALADVTALQFGSMSLIREPAASAYEALFLREAGGPRLVSFDPNIRPSLVSDESAYRARLQRLLSVADIVKISAADLDWLMPGAAHDDVAGSWLEGRASLVVITRGADGVMGWTRRGQAQARAIPTTVIDTVGAGDSFTAGLLAGLHDREVLTPAGLGDLSDMMLHEVLALGQQVASMTCSRRGADAPWRDELAGRG